MSSCHLVLAVLALLGLAALLAVPGCGKDGKTVTTPAAQAAPVARAGGSSAGNTTPPGPPASPSAGSSTQPGQRMLKVAAVETRVLTKEEAVAAPGMLQAEVSSRIRQANQREDQAWGQVKSADDWAKFITPRLAALRESLGRALDWAGPRKVPAETTHQVEVTATVPGEGYRIQNLVIAGRPGLPITGNLYLPNPLPKAPMPGILICTSHHNGKTQSELLDMGMIWARAGAMVLVLDNIGYNERRQHPMTEGFVPREDYRWRYYLGIQLYSVGESLMGWVVDDLHTGIDVLLSRPGIDPKRIIAMGSVASGGDAVAVLAAFDKRITCSIPFNYGSAHTNRPTTQGDMDKPGRGFMSAEADGWVDYVGGGDWETTRCLRDNAKFGYLPWVIVAGGAPRPLIFAKEFGWDPTTDPGFARINWVYKLCDAKDKLAFVHGSGKGDLDPGATAVNNVGPTHRKAIYPILQRWFDMPIPQESRKASAEYKQLYEQLTCLTPAARDEFPQRKVYEVLGEMAGRRLAAVRADLAKLSEADRRAKLRKDWARLLGNIEPAGVPKVLRATRGLPTDGSDAVEKILLAPEPGIVLPMVLLTPPAGSALAAKPAADDLDAERKPSARHPVVLCVAQSGKKEFLAKRGGEVAELLKHGVAVCLVDVRGTGETKPPGGHTWNEPAIEIASEELMTGRTLLGGQLRDLRAVVRYMETRDDLDCKRLAVWGESFAGVNPPDYVDPPMQTKLSNELAEPLGTQLAMFAALYEDNVRAVLARGGLTGFLAVLDGPACHVSLECMVPQAVEAGDLADVVATLAPRPVRIEAAVDGRDRLADLQQVKKLYAPALAGYAAKADRLELSAKASADTAAWLAGALGGK